MNILESEIAEGKKVRFVVKSAEEAVQVIAERLGPKAQVVSVRQVEGEGLSRFLKSPKLEVVAMIPIAAPEIKSAVYNTAKRVRSAYDGSALASISLEDGLRRAGFDDGLLTDLACENHWSDWKSMTWQDGMAILGEFLINKYKLLPTRPMTQRIAVFGTPGVGVTTALCKLLARSVFWNRDAVDVLKLEGDAVNSDEELSVFCDVIGAHLHRDPVDVPHLNPEARLFLDVPGLPYGHAGWKNVKDRLQALKIDTRILVIHAGYDGALLQKAYALGKSLSATHCLFSHADEVDSGTKLWRLVMRSDMTFLGLSHGQNVTADYDEAILPWLLEKTFPSGIIK